MLDPAREQKEARAASDEDGPQEVQWEVLHSWNADGDAAGVTLCRRCASTKTHREIAGKNGSRVVIEEATTVVELCGTNAPSIGRTVSRRLDATIECQGSRSKGQFEEPEIYPAHSGGDRAIEYARLRSREGSGSLPGSRRSLPGGYMRRSAIDGSVTHAFSVAADGRHT
jgi:hypothetical protein